MEGMSVAWQLNNGRHFARSKIYYNGYGRNANLVVNRNAYSGLGSCPTNRNEAFGLSALTEANPGSALFPAI